MTTKNYDGNIHIFTSETGEEPALVGGSGQDLVIEELKNSLLFYSNNVEAQGLNELSGLEVLIHSDVVFGRNQGTSVSVQDTGTDSYAVIGAPQFIEPTSLGAVYVFKSSDNGLFVENPSPILQYSSTPLVFFGQYSTINEDCDVIVTSDLGGETSDSNSQIYTNTADVWTSTGEEIPMAAMKASGQYIINSHYILGVNILFDSGSGYAVQQQLKTVEVIPPTGFLEVLDIQDATAAYYDPDLSILSCWRRVDTTWTNFEDIDLTGETAILGLNVYDDNIVVCSATKLIIFKRPDFTSPYTQVASFTNSGFVDCCTNGTEVFVTTATTIKVYTLVDGTWVKSFNDTVNEDGGITKIDCSSTKLIVGQPGIGTFGQSSVYRITTLPPSGTVVVNSIDMSGNDMLITSNYGDVLINGVRITPDGVGVPDPLLLSLGSATIPTYSFNGDSNTGMYSSGADNINFTTAGSSKLQVTGTQIINSVQSTHSDGTVTDPGITFTSDPNTGLYSVGADSLGISAGGVLSSLISTTAIANTIPTIGPSGTAALPAYSFSGDPNTGVYNPSADRVALSAGGADSLTATTSSLICSVPLYANIGTVSEPGITWNIDTDTGFYRSAANEIDITLGGTETTRFGTSFLSSTVPVFLPGGSASNPSLSFSSDFNTGIYNPSSDTLGISTGGVLRSSVSTTAITNTLPILAPDGDVSEPSYTFASDPNSGMYSNGPDSVGISTNATTITIFGNTEILNTVPLSGPSGSAAGPTYSFNGDSDTGMYNLAANAIGFSTGGSLRTTMSTTGISNTIPIFNEAGSAAAPAYSFNADIDTGMYTGVSGGEVSFAVGGANKMTVGSTSLTVAVPILAAAGSVSAPGISFSGDTDAGIYSASNRLEFATNGSNKFTIGTTSLSTVSPFRFADGNVSAPSISFNNDLDAGLYLASAGNLGISVGGVQQVSYSTGGASYDGAARTIQTFKISTATVGSISVTGSTTSYNTTSDRRLKNTIEDMTGSLEIINQLSPKTYKWNSDDSKGCGLIAQDLVKILPECVTGIDGEMEDIKEFDGRDNLGNDILVKTTEVIKPMMVDYTKLVPHLISAIKELTAKISVLESKTLVV